MRERAGVAHYETGLQDCRRAPILPHTKRYRAPRTRGHSKNGRGDAPKIVVGLAVTRDGFPVRHWVFPGNAVDVTTVEQVKSHLRGWQLNRCVFVGDAGMVSENNLSLCALVVANTWYACQSSPAWRWPSRS